MKIPKNCQRLGTRGFEFTASKGKKECVLIIGLNPAGDETDCKNEKDTRTYLYSLGKDKDKVKSPYVYNKYYRPIYDLVANIFDNDVK